MYFVKSYKTRDLSTTKDVETLLNKGYTLEQTVNHDIFILYIFKEPERSKPVVGKKRHKKSASDED
tara:strand:+ start:4190 stop:4387 length:198 start_codon:yes stop_codon:yes gene_type:complete